jgi:hypothetical protein
LVPIVNGALDALGQPRVMMRLGIYWATLNWAVVATVMQFRHDAFSFSLAYCIHIVFGNLAVVFAVRKLVPAAHLWPGIRAASISAIAAALFARFALLPWTTGPITLAMAIIAVTAVFGGAVVLLDRSAIVELRTLVQRGGKSARNCA